MMAAWSCGPDDDPVIQEDPAPESLTVSPASSSLEASSGEVALVVTAPQRPVVSGAPSWITVKDGTFNKYNITFTLVVSANETYDPRSATLTVSSGSLSQTVTVSQAASEKPAEPEEPETPEDPQDPSDDEGISETLVTADATDEAKALYGFILEQYGKKIISSIMADVNWNHREADKVYSATGKYPAMNCYDFIHIYVPENNWIDYSDLTPVTEWAEAGGIVSLMWHFNVPVDKNTKPSSSGAGVTCTPGQTTFRAKNIFTDGSWENEWFYGQMDKVADVILGLQEKGIAAVWRPFHEAAGNATYKRQASWATSWFWWGFDGSDVYKKVWMAMFDYFQSKGIRNLIWVWTTQNYNGDSSGYDQDTAWYPGDKYVDIVARDLYGGTAAGNKREFEEIQKGYPRKMVALGECGNDSDSAFPAIPAVWSAGAKWSWFMPWYGSNMPDETWWKTTMSNNNVVTRTDVKY